MIKKGGGVRYLEGGAVIKEKGELPSMFVMQSPHPTLHVSCLNNEN